MKAGPRDSNPDLFDIQGIVRSGFGQLRCSEYVLLDIDTAQRDAALAWLRKIKKHVPSVMAIGRNAVSAGGQSAPPRPEAWAIAFTHRGLTKLGVREDENAPFPSAFKGGQARLQRRRLLRDDLDETWSWGDTDGASSDQASDGRLEPVSMLVIRMFEGPALEEHADLSNSSLSGAGLRVVRRILGDPDSFRARGSDKEGDGKAVPSMYEPFGFRDAIAQPVPRGLVAGSHSEQGAGGSDREMPLGEFVLGHRNLYGEHAHSPRVMAKDQSSHAFGLNGSYLAVRQIHQFVADAEKFESEHPLRVGTTPSVLEKMVGRYKNGSPLQTCPTGPTSPNDFAYRLNDSQGFDCPAGAHIRRANPRDSLSLSEYDVALPARLHSMLRRGRPYLGDFRGELRTDRPAIGTRLEHPSGLIFIALVADIERQFEFVQRQWIANATFGNLHDSRDPIAGSQGTGQMTFPGQPVGIRIRQIPKLTQALGGGYFFLPGLAVLDALSDGSFSTTLR